jgi:superfamily II DNA/RNA helicase
MDHFSRGKLMLSQVNILVIDEADRMLDMGFIPDVEEICKKLPFTRQTLFYSATMPPEIQKLADKFLHNPVRVEVSRPATTATNIRQEIIDVPANDWAKREALRRLIKEAGEITNAIVFCNRKRDVDIVAKSLAKHGFNASPLHGDLDQSLRTKTLDGFRAGTVQILVASDVAARGLDIPAVSHVFNYDVPFHADDYVHRIGRTGRAGRSGEAYMLATSRDFKQVADIEKLIGTKLEHRTLEGLAEAVQARPAGSDRPRNGRDRNGGRGGRDRDRKQHNRPVADHGHRASMEPVVAAPVAEVPRAVEQQQPVQHAPQEHRRPKQDHRQNKPQHQKQQAQNKEPKTSDAHQLPAFLLRPVKLPPAEKPKKKIDVES